MIGRHKQPGIAQLGACEMNINAALDDFEGYRAHHHTCVRWAGQKDDYCYFGLTYDYTSKWKDGKEVFTSIADSNSIENMLHNYFAPQVLEVRCDHCGSKTMHEQQSCVRTAPEHLLLSVKRFEVDYQTGRTSKMLNTVQLEQVISLPGCPERLRPLVFNTDEEEALFARNE